MDTRRLVGSIKCSFFYSPGIEYARRALVFRPLDFILRRKQFDQLKHIHLQVTGSEWEEAAIHEYIVPIAKEQEIIEQQAMERYAERLQQKREKRAADFREVSRHGELDEDPQSFYGPIGEDSATSEDDMDDPLSDISATREGHILRGDHEAIEDAWDELEGNRQEIHYHDCLFRPGHVAIIELIRMVRREELDSVTLDFISLTYQQYYVLDEFESEIMVEGKRKNRVKIMVDGGPRSEWGSALNDIHKHEKLIITRSWK